MTKFLKAASLAAVSLTLLSSVVTTDRSFAFGAQQGPTTIKADDILIDPTQITNDIGSEKVSADENIIFVSEEVLAPVPEKMPVAVAPTQTVDADSLSELVSMQDTDSALDAEMRCLAGTVYFESKGESLVGQLAVAKVVLNRTESRRWPNSICGVVYQRSQFSFVRGGRMPKIRTSSRAWRNAKAIAQIAMADAWDSPVDDALYFHANYVSPGWRLTRVGAVDKHIFYR